MSDAIVSAAGQTREIITKAEAKAAGLKCYFTGEPCRHGHVAERIASNGDCYECMRERVANWQAANPEAVRESRARYNTKNAENIRERSARYSAENQDKRRASKARWSAKNPGYATRWRNANIDAAREREARYRAENPEKARERAARNYAANPNKVRERNARYLQTPAGQASRRKRRATRRARELQAVPCWYGEFDDLVMTEAANLAAMRESATGFPWEVDHMIPLACRKACGLHCAENMQVIPARVNESKQNKFILTNPGEWLRHL